MDCLSDYPPVLKKRVLLELLAELSGSKKDLSREHADALLDLAGGQTGRRLSLPYGITAEKIYGDLVGGLDQTSALFSKQRIGRLYGHRPKGTQTEIKRLSGQ